MFTAIALLLTSLSSPHTLLQHWPRILLFHFCVWQTSKFYTDYFYQSYGCWRCFLQSTPYVTIEYMFRKCPRLCNYWVNIFQTLSKVLKVQLKTIYCKKFNSHSFWFVFLPKQSQATDHKLIKHYNIKYTRPIHLYVKFFKNSLIKIQGPLSPRPIYRGLMQPVPLTVYPWSPFTNCRC